MTNDTSDDARSVVGVWIDTPLFGPGGMSDWLVVFQPDRMGRVEFINPVLVNVWTFQWKLIEPQVLRVKGNEYQWLDDDNVVVSESWALRKDISFAIEDGVSAMGQPIVVLRLTGGWDDEFIPHEFAFGTTVEEYGEPQWASSVKPRPS